MDEEHLFIIVHQGLDSWQILLHNRWVFKFVEIEMNITVIGNEIIYEAPFVLLSIFPSVRAMVQADPWWPACGIENISIRSKCYSKIYVDMHVINTVIFITTFPRFFRESYWFHVFEVNAELFSSSSNLYSSDFNGNMFYFISLYMK